MRDLDLSSGRIAVVDSKTPAGVRPVDILPVLRDELVVYKAGLGPLGPEERLFATATGGRRDKDNIRQRVMEPVAERANELLAERGLPPLPEGFTAHKLRHTFASILAACGEDLACIMAQLGHTDPKFTLRVYTHLMRRRDGERERLRALVQGAEWAEMGRNRRFRPHQGVGSDSIPARENPSGAGDPDDGRGWFRTSDLSRVKRDAEGRSMRSKPPLPSGTRHLPPRDDALAERIAIQGRDLAARAPRRWCSGAVCRPTVISSWSSRQVTEQTPSLATGREV